MALETDRAQLSFSCKSAEDFTKLFYEYVDKMRHKLAKLYLTTGRLVWNGNAVEGNDTIQKFYEDLPPSFHSVTCLDSQPVRQEAVGQQCTIQVSVAGYVTLKDHRYPFHQAFLVTVKDDKWKVVTDVFRFQQPPE